MMALILAAVFWLAGLIMLAAGFVLTRKLRSAGEELLYQAEHEKGKDNSASIAMTIEGCILNNIPSYIVHMVTGVAGSVLLVLGFVAIAFYVR